MILSREQVALERDLLSSEETIGADLSKWQILYLLRF